MLIVNNQKAKEEIISKIQDISMTAESCQSKAIALKEWEKKRVLNYC